MYQRTFMATPAEDDYYKEMMKSLIKANNEGENDVIRIFDKQSLI